MTNNDILRRIRYAFDIKDNDMLKIFAFSSVKITREELLSFLKKEDDIGYKVLSRDLLEAFLDGFIVFKRGPKK